MKIVIDIPEEMHKEYVSVELGRGNGKNIVYNLLNAIKNGTPLPEHHGDLISKEQAIELVEFYQLNPQHFDFVNLIDEIKDEKPIIEGSESE